MLKSVLVWKCQSDAMHEAFVWEEHGHMNLRDEGLSWKAGNYQIYALIVPIIIFMGMEEEKNRKQKTINQNTQRIWLDIVQEEPYTFTYLKPSFSSK